MSSPKYHHLISRVYLRAWCCFKNGVYTMDKYGVIERKNINNNFGVNHFHSIKAGMPICRLEDLIEIFKVLEGYEVFLGKKKLKNVYEYNKNYYNFNNWIIKKENKIISRKIRNKIKNKINQTNIMSIEHLWDIKYEKKWRDIRINIESKLLKSNFNYIEEFDKDLIIKFIVLYNLRGFHSNDELNMVCDIISTILKLDKINLPFRERKRNVKTAEDSIRHLFILNEHYNFLNDYGYMYNIAKSYLDKQLKFFIADGNKKFITSDNPSFIYKNEFGYKIHFMAISPKVAVCIDLNSKSDKYIIDKVNDNEVAILNKKIRENSVSKIILNTNKLEEIF